MTFFQGSEGEPNEFEYPKPRPVLGIFSQRGVPVQYTEEQKRGAEWVESVRGSLDQAISLMKQAATERQSDTQRWRTFIHGRQRRCSRVLGQTRHLAFVTLHS
jgi:hypothetical protein